MRRQDNNYKVEEIIKKVEGNDFSAYIFAGFPFFD